MGSDSPDAARLASVDARADAISPDTEGPVDLGAGLIGYWKLDDGEGAGRALDSSGHSNHANAESVSPSDWLTVGRIGGALGFGNAGWLLGTNSESINAITTRFTIALWIRLNAPEDGEQVILQRQAGTSAEAHFQLRLRARRPALTGVRLPSCEGPALPTGSWVHLAATYDGATARLLVAGVEVAACAGVAAIAPDTTMLTIGAAQIGESQFNVDRRLHADLDEVALWRRALSRPELQTLAAGQVPPAAR